MSYQYANKIYLQSPQGDKNYALCIEHEDSYYCERFKRELLTLPVEFRWFLQSDGAHFKMFEFWTDLDAPRNRRLADDIIEIGLCLAKKLGLEFDIV